MVALPVRLKCSAPRTSLGAVSGRAARSITASLEPVGKRPRGQWERAAGLNCLATGYEPALPTEAARTKEVVGPPEPIPGGRASLPPISSVRPAANSGSGAGPKIPATGRVPARMLPHGLYGRRAA